MGAGARAVPRPMAAIGGAMALHRKRSGMRQDPGFIV
jgi:hypothetical protein